MILLNPGPVNVSPRVTAALGRGDLCHREPECAALLERIRTRLVEAFAPRGGFSAVLLTGSGTAALEAAVTGILSARGRLVVVASSALSPGEAFELDATQLTVGRGANNDLSISDDEYASSRHARFEPRHDGVWIEDVGSTNGTFVNGIRLTRERRLTPGDVVRIGETDLRFEP
jgi:phosphoserine aminotransferase